VQLTLGVFTAPSRSRYVTAALTTIGLLWTSILFTAVHAQPSGRSNVGNVLQGCASCTVSSASHVSTHYSLPSSVSYRPNLSVSWPLPKDGSMSWSPDILATDVRFPDHHSPSLYPGSSSVSCCCPQEELAPKTTPPYQVCAHIFDLLNLTSNHCQRRIDFATFLAWPLILPE
jgi:hypothetical protein